MWMDIHWYNGLFYMSTSCVQSTELLCLYTLIQWFILHVYKLCTVHWTPMLIYTDTMVYFTCLQVVYSPLNSYAYIHWYNGLFYMSTSCVQSTELLCLYTLIQWFILHVYKLCTVHWTPMLIYTDTMVYFPTSCVQSTELLCLYTLIQWFILHVYKLCTVHWTPMLIYTDTMVYFTCLQVVYSPLNSYATLIQCLFYMLQVVYTELLWLIQWFILHVYKLCTVHWTPMLIYTDTMVYFTCLQVVYSPLNSYAYIHWYNGLFYMSTSCVQSTELLCLYTLIQWFILHVYKLCTVHWTPMLIYWYNGLFYMSTSCVQSTELLCLYTLDMTLNIYYYYTLNVIHTY